MNKSLMHSLYLVALAHLVLELCANFLPVIYPIAIAEMGLTYVQVGFIALVLGVGGSLFQPVFGYLSDRWNPRQMTVLSILWIGTLMSLVGFTWNYLSLVLLVGLASLGSAAFHPAGATIASDSSSTRRGAAISVFSVGGNLGAALSPLLVTVGISWLGPRGTGILLPVMALCCLLLYLHWRGQPPPTTQQLPLKPAPTQSTRLSAAKNGSALGLALIVVAVMCRSWFQVSMATYLPEWMRSQGWSLAAGGQMLFVLLVTVSVGSLVGGTLSDRVGRWQVVAISLLLMAPAQWLFLSTTGMWRVGLVGFMGMMIGGSFPVAIIMAQETWPRGVGMASALVMGLGWLPGGVGASFTGFIADQTSLGLGLQSLIIPPLVGSACILIYALLYQRQRTTGKFLTRTTPG